MTSSRTRRSLALSFILYFACNSSGTVQARSKDRESLDLDWEQPSSGDIFSPGDSIIAQWTSRKALVSPSVSLCPQSSSAGDTDDASGCGASVWPEITHDGDSYSFTLAVPDISSAAGFHLRIKDDFGNTVNSPTFSLGPTKESAKGIKSPVDDDTSSASPSEAGLDGEIGSGSSDESTSAQIPLNDATDGNAGVRSSSPGPSRPVATGSDSEKPTSSQQQHSTPVASGGPRAKNEAQTSNASLAVPQTHATSLATGAVPTIPGGKSGVLPNGSNEDSFTPRDGALSRAGVPTAAIAIPISLVGATVLVSIGLCIVHRRSLAAQRARNAHLIDIQRSASIRSAGSKAPSVASGSSSKRIPIDDPDIEKAIDALCSRDGRASLRRSSLQRDDSVRDSSHYSFPRPDIRRELTYEWPHEYDRDHDYNLRFSRAPSERYMHHRDPSPSPGYHRPHSSFERYSRSTRGYQRRSRNSIMEMFRYDRRRDRSRVGDDAGDDKGASSTDTPSIHSPRPSHRDSYLAQPRLPPRSHSRHTAPDMRYQRRHRWDNSYDDDASPTASSRRSW